jgi:nucleolar protein 56
MKTAHVVRSPIGAFAFSDDAELIYYTLYSKNAKTAVEQFDEIPKELADALKGYDIIEDKVAQTFLRKKFRELALSLGFADSSEELDRFLSEFCLLISQKSLKGAIGRDKLIIQSSNALEDLNKIYNLLQERLYEWFSLHYPELKQRDIAKLVAQYGRRENFPNFKFSLGVDLNESDEAILREYAKFVEHASIQKRAMEKYIKEAVKEVSPNLSAIIDPLLGANLMALAGSLEKLAKMPASTIQLLGAEKALFRHLHNKGKSPKYGILYNSSIIQNAKPENRGKVARVISSKIMLAARIDFYSGRHDENIVKQLQEELKKVGA